MIEAEKANYRIAWMCSILRVPRSSFYAWRHEALTPTQARRAELAVLVGKVFDEFRAAVQVRPEILECHLVAGGFDAWANGVYVIAVQTGMLSVVAVLGSLYPAATVLLARYVLAERLRPAQKIGMVTALVAAVLLAVPA